MRVIEGKGGRRRSPAVVDLRQSSIEAYRNGLAGGIWQAPSPRCAKWICVAASLQAAGLASPDERSDMVGGLSTVYEMVDQMEHERHFALAAHVLDSLAFLLPGDSTGGARLLRSRSIRDALSALEAHPHLPEQRQ